MAGIEDVARRAGVSVATVSRALSGRGPVSPATRDKVRAMADELGYVVSPSASGLASGTTRTVGIVVPFLTSWFYTSVIEGAQATLLDHGYDVTLYNLFANGDVRGAVFERSLRRRRDDALIAVSLELSEPERALLTGTGKPIVGVGGPLEGVPTLSVDDVGVARLATEHVIMLGHTRIAHLGGDVDHELDFHVPSQRRLGYEAALTAAGIEVDPTLFVVTEFSIEGGYHSAKQLLGDPRRRPTAIVAASDEMALGAMLAARHLGLSVPQDISISGIDGHELAEFAGLTTVDQYPARQGAQAAELLVECLASGLKAVDATDRKVDYDLVVRGSTGPVHSP